MAGIGIVSVSHAAAGATSQSSQSANSARDSGAISNSNQQAVISQIAAQSAPQRLNDDAKRDVSTQKRTEAGFSSNQDETHKDENNSTEESVENGFSPNQGKLNLKA